jgi:hypothetical protein
MNTNTAKAELRQLHFRLVATRARFVLAQLAMGLAAAVALAIGLLTIEMTLDWLVHLPWLARACFSLPAIGGAAWLLYREAFLPLLRMPGDHAIACAIERAMPVFQTRLIASIQLGRDARAKNNALVRALIRETAAIASAQDFRKAVSLAKMLRTVRALACIVIVAGILAWAGRANVALLLDRALLLTARLPTRTRIEKIEAPSKLAAGEDLNIAVQAAGVIPAEGRIVADSGARTGEYKLEPDPQARGRFRCVIHGVPDSLTFRAYLNDAMSEPVSVSVFSPPVVLGVHPVEVFPAYTHLPPAPRETGDLSLLAGSALRLAIDASAPVQSGSIHLLRAGGPPAGVPVTVDAANPREVRGEIPIPVAGLTGFSIELVDRNGIPSHETTVYRIDIVPDLPPVIQLTHPGEETTATPVATELVAFHARDDFGVARVLLHYMVNHGPEKVIEFNLGGATPGALDRRFDWSLAPLKLAPGGLVEYWMEAIDANDVTGPGRGNSALGRIKIVTEAEKREELAERINDALGSLDQVSQSEDALTDRLGKRIFARPGAP